jgi:hypothetical protein
MERLNADDIHNYDIFPRFNIPKLKRVPCLHAPYWFKHNVLLWPDINNYQLSKCIGSVSSNDRDWYLMAFDTLHERLSSNRTFMDILKKNNMSITVPISHIIACGKYTYMAVMQSEDMAISVFDENIRDFHMYMVVA